MLGSCSVCSSARRRVGGRRFLRGLLCTICRCSRSCCSVHLEAVVGWRGAECAALWLVGFFARCARAGVGSCGRAHHRFGCQPADSWLTNLSAEHAPACHRRASFHSCPPASLCRLPVNANVERLLRSFKTAAARRRSGSIAADRYTTRRTTAASATRCAMPGHSSAGTHRAAPARATGVRWPAWPGTRPRSCGGSCPRRGTRGPAASARRPAPSRQTRPRPGRAGRGRAAAPPRASRRGPSGTATARASRPAAARPAPARGPRG
mmetsp:Transcript_20831/g.79916  ORF Transcript_20831/g.79916 Transcript_20831/m.79916 type:complete len:265 (+) Transcript_20831:297-1091(+)